MGGNHVQKIALVTDSTADLTMDMTVEFNAHVIPLKISFGQQDIMTVNLRRLSLSSLESASEMPGQPFLQSEIFNFISKLLEHYDEIISIHLSSKLSVL